MFVKFALPPLKVEELMQIANGFLSKQQLSLTPDAAALLRAKFQAMFDAPDKQNGNGRAVRNMVEQAMRSQVGGLLFISCISLSA